MGRTVRSFLLVRQSCSAAYRSHCAVSVPYTPNPALHSRPSVVWCPGTATQEGLSLVVERSELEAASLAGGEAGCAPNPNTGIRTISRLEVKVVGSLPIPAACAHPLP
jgi:hypothetical protein